MVCVQEGSQSAKGGLPDGKGKKQCMYVWGEGIKYGGKPIFTLSTRATRKYKRESKKKKKKYRQIKGDDVMMI